MTSKLRGGTEPDQAKIQHAKIHQMFKMLLSAICRNFFCYKQVYFYIFTSFLKQKTLFSVENFWFQKCNKYFMNVYFINISMYHYSKQKYTTETYHWSWILKAPAAPHGKEHNYFVEYFYMLKSYWGKTPTSRSFTEEIVKARIVWPFLPGKILTLSCWADSNLLQSQWKEWILQEVIDS